jgi:hypothetical protein
MTDHTFGTAPFEKGHHLAAIAFNRLGTARHFPLARRVSQPNKPGPDVIDGELGDLPSCGALANQIV